MRRTRALACGGVAVLLLVGTAHAATLKVGQGKTYATIGDAVAAAADGDKILVFKGRYTETVTVAGKADLVLQAKKGVEWMPAGWGETCLTLSQGADGARVQGFTFRTVGNAISLEGVNDVSVLKCRFRGQEWAVRGVGDDLVLSKCDVRRCGNGLQVEGRGTTVEKSAFVAIHRDGIDLTGDDVVFAKNTVRIVMDSSSVRVTGNGARFEKNRIRVSTRHGIEVIGDGATVVKNDVSQPSDDGIHVVGAGAVVERNLVRSSGDDGISVAGPGFTVTRNRVYDTNDAEAAIAVDNQSGPGPATLANNLVIDSAQRGFTIRGAGVVSSGNTARDCGSRGVETHGTGHVLTGDKVFGANRQGGFQVNSSDTRLVRCEARECVQDGFRINGADVELEGCRAFDCAAEGLHNAAVSTTTFAGCTFLDNRQDVGADPAGTLVDGGGNTYETGGTDVAPVD